MARVAGNAAQPHRDSTLLHACRAPLARLQGCARDNEWQRAKEGGAGTRRRNNTGGLPTGGGGATGTIVINLQLGTVVTHVRSRIANIRRLRRSRRGNVRGGGVQEGRDEPDHAPSRPPSEGTTLSFFCTPFSFMANTYMDRKDSAAFADFA